jgi:hypothetical protein
MMVSFGAEAKNRPLLSRLGKSLFQGAVLGMEKFLQVR